MALVYLYQRQGRYLALEYDDVGEEVTAVVYSNLTDRPWPVKYDWKTKVGQTATIPPQTEGQIGIPPGQRRFVRLTPADGYRQGFDGELGSWEA
jgi:hypothetical protein